jgi:hypothetical protein
MLLVINKELHNDFCYVDDVLLINTTYRIVARDGFGGFVDANLFHVHA